jgi:hypothetical protein
MAVTEEQRREVRDADCAQFGHILSFDRAMQLDGPIAQVAGPGGMQAHIDCRRCRKVWLVVEQPERDYEAATVALDARLLPEHRRRVSTGIRGGLL